MKIIKHEDAEQGTNLDNCKTIEYSFGDKDIDLGVAVITGRYPEKGYCTNEECQELCYVLEGEGTINRKDETINFKQGDVIFIEKKDVYFWNGNCKLALVCNPAWSKDQCKLLD